MPIRTRARKATEQTTVQNEKPSSKNAEKKVKPARRPLADKTNSASDDNKSVEVAKTSAKNPNVSHNLTKRTRKVPNRFIESNLLQKLSLSHDKSQNENKPPPMVKEKAKPIRNQHSASVKPKHVENILSRSDTENVTPPKSKERPKPVKKQTTSSVRPRRVHNLPLRFEDHSISPSKFIPLSPCFASTPLAKPKKDALIIKRDSLRVKHKISSPTPIDKKKLPQKQNRIRNKRIINKDYSIKLLQDCSVDKMAVYDFTFDPQEEPQRKRKVITKITKPRVRRPKKPQPPPPPVDIMPAPDAAPAEAPEPPAQCDSPPPGSYSPGAPSFFACPPAAGSTPRALPWRPDYSGLSARWPPTCYVKADMTPAVERSFNDPNEGRKHVYTNMLDSADMFVPEKETKSRQTSILDFIREVAEKSIKKPKTPRKPAKESVPSVALEPEVPPTTPMQENPAENPASPVEVHENQMETDENQMETDEMPMETAATEPDFFDAVTSPKPANEPSDKYFGFDDSENRENVSPVKGKRGRQLRSRTRAVLKEINSVMGPMRANVPLTKPLVKLTEAIEPVKEAVTETQVLPEDTNTSDQGNSSREMDNIEAQSIHLFEDVDVLHTKPPRRSYAKAKKVTVTLPSDDEEEPDEEFHLPVIKKRRAVLKKNAAKMTKKEEAEAEAWAAAFNSMCEDVQEYDLVLE